MSADPFDIFTGLGGETPRGRPTNPFIGLGTYRAEVLAITLKPSDNEKKRGHMIFRAEFLNRETLCAVSDDTLDALNKRVAGLKKARANQSYPGTNPEGTAMVEVYNLTKHGEYAMADVRSLMGALIVHAKDRLSADQMAQLKAAIEDENADEWAVFARMVCEGDGQLFAGTQIRIMKRPHAKLISEGGLAMPRTFFDNDFEGNHNIGLASGDVGEEDESDEE